MIKLSGALVLIGLLLASAEADTFIINLIGLGLLGSGAILLAHYGDELKKEINK